MTIHKEGYISLIITIVFLGIINLLANYFLPNNQLLSYLLLGISLILFLVVLQFFRSPNITTIIGENLIIAPADGKVVVIEETVENEYFKDKRIQVSIFMSPINVHINRNPMSGLVKFAKYHPGLFLVAWHPKSSTENERTTIVVENSNKVSILFRQIAGALARRIVFYIKEGDEVKQSEEFGFIKFGSRVDVYLPLGTTIKVGLNEVVQGGRTIIAEL